MDTLNAFRQFSLKKERLLFPSRHPPVHSVPSVLFSQVPLEHRTDWLVTLIKSHHLPIKEHH